MGITLWKKLAFEPPYTRVEFRPLTGRTHQLRLHASHEFGLGAPIVDDPLYGKGKSHGKMKLHASYLAFLHPTSQTLLEFFSPPPF
jgi:tRNA pseudouridine32 synthase/23S rRNA pseudouridine746 synthase